MSTRTIVLLGAGASRDSGLPLTGDLAELVVARANADDGSRHRRQQPSGVAELNFIYSAMMGHQGEHGDDPLQAVNIETLISAVRLLQSRESHEVAPFVASWKEGARGFPNPSSSIGSDYARAMQSAVDNSLQDRHFGGRDLAELVAKIASEVMSRPDTSAFANLEILLLRSIREFLTNITSVDYLQPLAHLARDQPGGLDVITLNYDLTIEMLAEQCGIEIDRGIERWAPGAPLEFEQVNGRINLMKLHGSVDWELTVRTPSTVHPPQVNVVEPEPANDPDDYPTSRRRVPGLPWIVVGDREKLATDGPTLDLLHAARTAMDAADSLVVIGYSFADAHVNAMVRNWMAVRPDRTLTVVDPGWPTFDADEPRGHLAKAYGGSDSWNQPGAMPRIAVFKEPAAAALQKALSVDHALEDPIAEAHWGPLGAIEIRYFGQPLTGVRVWGSLHPKTGVSIAASADERDNLLTRRLPANSRRAASLGDLAHGGTATIFPVLPNEPTELKITVEGDHLVGHRIINLALPAPLEDAPRAAPPPTPAPKVPRTRR